MHHSVEDRNLRTKNKLDNADDQRQACLIASITLECLATRWNLGTHIWEIDIKTLASTNKFLFIGEFFGIIGISFAKTSFCLTLLRLAVQRWHKFLIWGCIISVNLFMWPCGITFFVGCTPMAKKWDDTIPGHCIDAMPVVYFAVFAGVWSAMTDFVLAVFPWFLVWNLQMRLHEKIGVCVCMSMGVLSGVFAIVKSAYLIPSFDDYTCKLNHATNPIQGSVLTPIFFSPLDKSTPLLIWSGSELAIVIMASSIPFLRLFWKEMQAKTNSSRSRSKSGYINGDYKLDHMKSYAKMGSSNHASAIRTQVRAEPKTQDDDSDKSILAQSRIMRTDEITIEHGLAKDMGHERTYEVV